MKKLIFLVLMVPLLVMAQRNGSYPGGGGSSSAITNLINDNGPAGVLSANNTHVGTNVTSVQVAAAGGVTNKVGAQSIISYRDPYNLYVTGSTNSNVNISPYSWAGYITMKWSTNALNTPLLNANQAFCPAWTNSMGYMIWFSTDNDSDSDLILDYVLTKTNVDRSTFTNWCYLAGAAGQVEPIPGTVSQTFYPVATNWNQLLNPVITGGDAIANVLFGPPFPTIRYGTNTVTNISITASSSLSNNIITIDPINGDDTVASIGGKAFKNWQVADYFAKQAQYPLRWNFLSGTNDFTHHIWYPSNAVITAQADSVFTGYDKNRGSFIFPCGTFKMNGGYIYQPAGWGWGAMALQRNDFTGNYIEFRNVRALCDYSVIQNSTTNALDEYMYDCDWTTGSWNIELNQVATAPPINLYVFNSLLKWRSMNPTLSSSNAKLITTMNATIHIQGSSLSISNSFSNVAGTRGWAPFFQVMAGVDKVYSSGNTYEVQGTNKLWYFVDIFNNGSGVGKMWSDVQFPTNKLNGEGYLTNIFYPPFTNF